MSKTVAKRARGAAAKREAPAKLAPFANDSPWHMTADDEAEWQATHNTSLPPTQRIQYAAAARSNFWGHAAFGPGELESMLRIPRTTLNRALGNLRSQGLIAPESNVQCIVLNGGLHRVMREDRKVACLSRAHRQIRRRHWIPRWGGWEPEEGMWDGYLEEDTTSAGEKIQEMIAMLERAVQLGEQAQVQRQAQQVILVNSGTINGNVSIGTAQQQVSAADADLELKQKAAEQERIRDEIWERRKAEFAQRPVRAEVIQAVPVSTATAAPVGAPIVPRPMSELPKCKHPDGCQEIEAGQGLCWDHQCEADMATAIPEKPKPLVGRLTGRPAGSGWSDDDDLDDDEDLAS